MRLSLNIKPIRFESQTKEAVMRKAVGARRFTVPSFVAVFAPISCGGVLFVGVYIL